MQRTHAQSRRYRASRFGFFSSSDLNQVPTAVGPCSHSGWVATHVGMPGRMRFSGLSRLPFLHFLRAVCECPGTVRRRIVVAELQHDISVIAPAAGVAECSAPELRLRFVHRPRAGERVGSAGHSGVARIHRASLPPASGAIFSSSTLALVPPAQLGSAACGRGTVSWLAQDC